MNVADAVKKLLHPIGLALFGEVQIQTILNAVGGDINDTEKKRSISALKVQVGKSGRFVGQNAIQLHGGMGMTDELNIGHYFKRLTAIETLFGNVDHHLKKYSNVA